MYKVFYTGCGQIEVDLPSYPTGIIIKHGEFAKLKLSKSDTRVIDSLRSLGLRYEKIEEKAASVLAATRLVTVDTVDPAISEPIEVKEESAEEKISYTKDDLMKKTAGDLKGILKSLGSEDYAGKSKSEMADMILEISNDSKE